MIRYAIYALVAFGVAAGVTGPKLYDVARLRDWLPGATSTEVTVTDKWHQTREQGAFGASAWWLAWDGGNIREVGPHRNNLSREGFETVSIGDAIEVRWLPDDPIPYFRDGIFTSYGNLVLDLFLLAFELLLGVRFARKWREAFEEWRDDRPRRRRHAAVPGD